MKETKEDIIWNSFLLCEESNKRWLTFAFGVNSNHPLSKVLLSLVPKSSGHKTQQNYSTTETAPQRHMQQHMEATLLHGLF